MHCLGCTLPFFLFNKSQVFNKRVGNIIPLLKEKQKKRHYFLKYQKRNYYYRNNYRNGLNEHQKVIWGLISANVIVYCLWKTANPKFMKKHFLCSAPGIIRGKRFHTLVTSFFSHESGMHLFTNMLGLYFFGGEMALILGAQRFLSIYMVSGIVSTAAQLAQHIYQHSYTFFLGASGAVNSCISFTILSFPYRTILLYGFIPIPAALFGGGLMLHDISGLKSSHQNICYVSHLTGALCGFIVWGLTRRHFRRF